MSARNLIRHVSLAAGAVTLVVALGGLTQQRDPDDEAIGAQNQKWMDLIVKKDAAAISEIYAEDGAMFPPNAPKVQGRAALKEAWTGFVSMPAMTLTFKTESLVFSQDHTMATDIGTYEFASGEGAAHTVDKGKSVVVWVKRAGTWLVLTDMFSSDAPPPPVVPMTDPQPDTAAPPRESPN